MIQVSPRAVHARLFTNFFFQFGALGVFLPFFTVYLMDRGFSGREVALLSTSFPLMQLIMPPLQGWLADTRMRRRTLYRVSLICGLAAFPLFYRLGSLGSMFMAFLIYGAFRTPLNSLLNTATFEALERTRGDYGRVRLGGSLGFVVFALAAGVWIEQFGQPRAPDLLGLALILQIVVGWRASLDGQGAGPTARAAPGAWRLLLGDRRWHAFLAGLVLSRMAETFYNVFYSQHLVDRGHGTTFIGVLWAIGVLSEVACLAASSRILARISPTRLITVSYLIAAARWLGIAYVEAAWALVLLQLLHGITFGLFYVAAVGWAHRNAPSGLTTSAQGLANAAMFGVAGLTGLLAAGWLYDAGGGTLLFEVAAALAATAIIAARVLERREARTTAATVG